MIRGNHIVGPRDNSDARADVHPISLGGDTDFATVTGNIIRKSNPNGSDELTCTASRSRLARTAP